MMSVKSSQFSTPDFDRLPAFRQWQKENGEDFSLLGYLSCVGRAELAIAFTQLFYPSFIKYNGGIFLEATFDESLYKQWWQNFQGDMNEVEKVLNYVRLEDWLPGCDRVGRDNLIYLGQVLEKTWTAALSEALRDLNASSNPSRKVELRIEEEEVSLTVYQNPSPVGIAREDVFEL